MQYVINALVKVKNAKATLHIPLFPVTTADGRRLFALMPVSDLSASQRTLSAPSSDVEHSIDEEWGYQGQAAVNLLECEQSPSASEVVNAAQSAPSSDVEHSIDEEWGYQGQAAVNLLECEQSPSASEVVDAAQSAPSSDVEHSIDEEWGYQGQAAVNLLECEQSPSASEVVDAAQSAPSSDVEHSIDEEWGYQGQAAVNLLECEQSPSASEVVDAAQSAPSSDVEHSIDEEWGYQGQAAVNFLECEQSPSASEAVDAAQSAPSSDVEHSIDEEWGYQGHHLKCEQSPSSSEVANEGISQLSHETVNLTNEAPQQTGPGSSSSSTEAVDPYSKSKTVSKVTKESHKSKTVSKVTKESHKSIMSDKNVSWKDVNDGNSSSWETSNSTNEASQQKTVSKATKESLKSVMSDKNVSWKQKPTLSVHVNDSRSNNSSSASEHFPFRMIPPHANLVAKKMADVNVILLGESGVGKSTWINSILNYLGRRSFDDALNRKKLFTPYKTVMDRGNRKLLVDYETSKIHYKPRSYAFQRNGYVYHFVDGPGVSTTFGPLKDRRNMDQLLQVFASFDHVNAICFLIEAGSQQLSDAFRFCFVDLLTVLPPSAMNNVFFCFTKSASTGFLTGNGVICLNELLTEYRAKGYLDSHFKVNMEHFMDNELLEHLALTHVASAKCIRNWDMSCAMTKKFLDEIAQLKPMDSKDVHRNFTAHRLLRKFVSHYRSARHERRTARSVLEKIKPCASAKLFDASEETVTPHLICTSRKCSKIYPIVGGGVARVYAAACHNPCRHKTVEDCAAKVRTRLDMCRGCGCYWKFHTQTDKKVTVRELRPKDLRAAEHRLLSATDVEGGFLNICLSLVHMFYGRSCCTMNHAYTDYLASAPVGQSEIDERTNAGAEWNILKQLMDHYEGERLKGAFSVSPTTDFGWLRKRFDWLEKHNVDTSIVAFFLDLKMDRSSRHVKTSC